MLIDRHGRTIDYVRLSMTDRCNLRCNYCLPEGFVNFLPREELLTYEEHFKLLSLLSKLGVRKLRLTGGEPFVRKDLMPFIRSISEANLFEEIHLTTNGTLTEDHLPELIDLGITGVNLSLDTLSATNFKRITGRDQFDKVNSTLMQLIDSPIDLKINAVILPGQNIPDLLDLVNLTKEHTLSVRFIEEMPFNGTVHTTADWWNYEKLLHYFSQHFDLIPLTSPKSSTSMDYKVSGFKGEIGIIAAYSRSFCGECNRLRIGPKGEIRTCLYGQQTDGLKELIRSNSSDELIADFLKNVILNKPKDGFAAEKDLLTDASMHGSMASIGG